MVGGGAVVEGGATSGRGAVGADAPTAANRLAVDDDASRLKIRGRDGRGPGFWITVARRDHPVHGAVVPGGEAALAGLGDDWSFGAAVGDGGELHSDVEGLAAKSHAAVVGIGQRSGLWRVLNGWSARRRRRGGHAGLVDVRAEDGVVIRDSPKTPHVGVLVEIVVWRE